MTYTFLQGSRPLVCIHRHHRLVRIHFYLPVLELQPSVFWVTPPGCRDSKRWQVDRCLCVTASGGVIGLICHMARPASGLESRTSFPLCTYMWNCRETRRVWRLTATTSTCIAYVNLPSVYRRCWCPTVRRLQCRNDCLRKNSKGRGRMLWPNWG